MASTESSSSNKTSNGLDTKTSEIKKTLQSKKEKTSTFGVFDVILSVLVTLLWIIDVTSDFQVALSHLLKEEWVDGWVLMTLLILAYFTVAFIGSYCYMSHRDVHKAWWVCRIVFLVLGLSPVIMTSEYIYYGWQTRTQSEKNDLFEKIAYNRAFQRFFQSFIPAGPNLCSHLYIMLNDKPDDTTIQAIVRVLATLSSWASLTSSALTCTRLLHGVRKMLSDNFKLSSQAFIFLWHLFETGARTLSIAALAVHAGRWTLILLLFLHFVPTAIWLIAIDKKKNCYTVTYDAICAYVMVFYQSFTSRPSRYMYFIFYVIYYAENFVMLGVWAGLTSDDDEWFYIPAIVSVVVCFLLHPVFQIIYYKFFHYTGQAKGEWMPVNSKDIAQSLTGVELLYVREDNTSVAPSDG